MEKKVLISAIVDKKKMSDFVNLLKEIKADFNLNDEINDLIDLGVFILKESKRIKKSFHEKYCG